MPQLMPLFWMSSGFMVMLIVVVFFNFYFMSNFIFLFKLRSLFSYSYFLKW